MPTNGTPYRSQAWFDTPELLVNSFLVLILYVPPISHTSSGLTEYPGPPLEVARSDALPIGALLRLYVQPPYTLLA